MSTPASRRITRIVIFSIIYVPFVAGLWAQGEVIEFTPDRWTFVNADTVEYMGRRSLIGSAVLKDVELRDGVIEVDIAVNGARSYPGIDFRIQSNDNFERFYIRPHRAGLYPDALQYTPTINRVAGWQIYNGEGFTAPVDLPRDQWVHVRMEIRGSQARVFVDNAEEPNLTIHELKHGISTGGIGLNGPRDGSAYFSNFSYAVDTTMSFDPPPTKVVPLGMITEWELSPAYRFSQIDVQRTPEQQGITDIAWQKVTGEPSGLIDIARFAQFVGGESDWVWARTTLHADSAMTRRLALGYSDIVKVFLNGRLLFTGNSGYQTRDPSFLGIIGLYDYFDLPLNQGDNELLLAIGESFGGWGLMCRIADTVYRCDGLETAWEYSRGFAFPESVVYDRERDILYVSNYYNRGREYLSKVRLDGTIEQLEWITGLNMPTGMRLVDDRLFVVERTGYSEVDVVSGQIINRHRIAGALLPNDISRDASGASYISDSRRNVIYKCVGGDCEIWLDDKAIQRPNGLLVDNGTLLVGNSGDGSIKVVDLDDKSMTSLVDVGIPSIMDGIVPDGNGNYIITDFNGRIFLVTPAGEKTLLLDTSAPELGCADIEYISDKQLLIVPGLYSNRLTAYSLKLPTGSR